MTTINIANATSAAKITRAQAMAYAIDHLTDCPQDIMDVLEKIQLSFTKKTANGPSKTEIENRKLAEDMGQYVISHFNEDDPGAINARVIADNVPGINTTQKVSAVVKYANDVQRIKINGKVAYVPASVEIVTE